MVSTAKRTGRYNIRRKSIDLSPFTKVSKDSELTWLEKGGQKGGVTTQEAISDALDEYARLFKAGIASNAEKLTLARAFPDAPAYMSASKDISPESVMVIGGPASVAMVDKEGHLITTNALEKAFKKYMDNFRTRNAMVLHSDVQVGWALPAYITKGGQIYKSGVKGKELFFICELRDDTRIAERVAKQIEEGKLRSYSIAGSATKVQNMQKGVMPYMQVDDMELAEVTVCEKGVNEGATFQILKAQTGKIDKEQAGYRPATEIELTNNIMCGTCKYYNGDDKTCESVDGIFEDTDYCKLFEAEEGEERTEKHPALIASPPKIKVRLILSADEKNIDFSKTLQELVQNPEWSTSEVQTQRDWWDFTKEDGMEHADIFLNIMKRGRGAAGMRGDVNPAMGNPEVELRHDPEDDEEKYTEILEDLKSPTGWKRGLPWGTTRGPKSRKKRVSPLDAGEARLQDAPITRRPLNPEEEELENASDDPKGDAMSDERHQENLGAVDDRRKARREEGHVRQPSKAEIGARNNESLLQAHGLDTRDMTSAEIRQAADAARKRMMMAAGDAPMRSGTVPSDEHRFDYPAGRTGREFEPVRAAATDLRRPAYRMSEAHPDYDRSLGGRVGPPTSPYMAGGPPRGDITSRELNVRQPAARRGKSAGESAAMDIRASLDVEKMTARVMNKLTKANDDPFSTKEAFTTLNNEEGRQKEHEQLLREYGFPNEIGAEANRYVPVVETETNDKGIPINPRGPWVVNEAGNDLGESHDEDSPSFSSSEKAQNREGKKTASVSKLQKENIMTLTQRLIKLMKQGGVGYDLEKQPQRYQGGAGLDKPTPRMPAPSIRSGPSPSAEGDMNIPTPSRGFGPPPGDPGEMAAGPTGSMRGGAAQPTPTGRSRITSGPSPSAMGDMNVATPPTSPKPSIRSGGAPSAEGDMGTAPFTPPTQRKPSIKTGGAPSAEGDMGTPPQTAPTRRKPSIRSGAPPSAEGMMMMEKSNRRTPPTMPFLSKQSL